MANNIPSRQNSSKSLERLAAQRHLYGWAKKAKALQIGFTLGIPLASLVLVGVAPDLKAWAALVGLLVALLDASVLDPYQRRLQRRGAVIQEVFDCEVLELPWNELKVGGKPGPEDIYAAAMASRNQDGLKDWYPSSVASLDIGAARIICQRANTWWDMKLRTGYRAGIIALLTTIILGAVVWSLAVGITMEKFVLALAAPLVPTVLWGIRECRRQAEAVSRLERLKAFSNRLWDDVSKGPVKVDINERMSRALQDEIYESRSSNPPIFDWIYGLSRGSLEEQMSQSSAQMVAEMQKHGHDSA